MMQITEDTPPDMLAGAMDLMVHLPDGKAAKMSVERSTPMMDVLVQITTSNHLQISGYVLQPLAINGGTPGYGEKILPYFPNTPIGTLDTQDIRVVAKNRSVSTLQRGTPQQPFESTFRLKVHLPRNQLYVERVSMNAHLVDIMRKMCDEKNLDANKYEFRHPGNLDQVLDLKLRLADYGITEVYAVSKGSNRLTQVFSSSDSIMAFRKDDDRKQKNSGGGLFNFLKRGGKVSNGSGSLSSDNRSISPTHSDDSRSVSPPVSSQPKLPQTEKPKPPMRKRRPAPKPPSTNDTPNESKNNEISNNAPLRKKDGLTICHSRNSSDSSGYHEASILSDNANTSLPRKRPQTLAESAHSKSTSNLSAMKIQSKSTSSLAFPSRNKKKAPPPPPVMKSASSVAHLENASPVVASPADAVDAAAKDLSCNRNHRSEAHNKTNEDLSYATNSPPESIASSLATTLSSNIETDIGNNNIKGEITEEEADLEADAQPTQKSPVPQQQQEQQRDGSKVEEKEDVKPESESTLSQPRDVGVKTAETKLEFVEKAVHPNEVHVTTTKECVVDKEVENTEWEYQLPSPPTAFRDSSPQPSTTDSETASDIQPSTDSILTSPELFEKLNVIKESQSEIQSTKSADSEDDKFISKLSLENLEKRKKLVYNRELATSLKYTENEMDDMSSKRSSVLSELEDVLSKPTPIIEANKNWNNVKKHVENFSARSDRTLPNFKITTYDIPKKKINIFEDDSIRSNVQPAPMVDNEVGMMRPQQEFNKHRCMTLNREFLQRSESFNTWTPIAPVKRSKSQVSIKPIVQKREEPIGETIIEDGKSKSTLDLTGLQSLEVMKAIRTTLTTTSPTTNTSSTTIKSSIDEVDHKPVHKPEVVEKPRRPVSYYETPSINLASWQERKPSFDNNKTVTTINNNRMVASHNITNKTSNNVSIKVNGSEAISQQSGGNVVIKVNQPRQDDSTKRFINHTTAVGYRKPLGNINKVETTMRPHSIAFDQYDASRVPIVRSVELKKPLKEMSPSTNGTSVTQIRPDADAVGGTGGKINLFENVVLRSTARRNERPNSVNLVANSDPRGQLLSDIRNFGGKKGLKTVKV